MLNDFQAWFAFAQAHLDFVGPVLGSLAGWILAIIVETWFMPPTVPIRRQRQILVILNVLASWVLSVVVWGALDGDDNLKRRMVISVAAAILAPVIYPAIAQIATRFFPSVGSAFASKVEIP